MSAFAELLRLPLLPLFTTPFLLSTPEGRTGRTASSLSCPMPFGGSWLTEDLIRASGDGGRIRTVSIGLTPSLWVAGWVGRVWLAVPWGRALLYCAQPGKCLVVSLLPTYVFSSLFINPSTNYPNLHGLFPACILTDIVYKWFLHSLWISVRKNVISLNLDSTACFMDVWTNHLTFSFWMNKED